MKLTGLLTWFPGCCWRCVAGSWWSRRSWTQSSWRRMGRRRWRRRRRRTRWGIWRCYCQRHCGSLTCWGVSPRYCRSGCLLLGGAWVGVEGKHRHISHFLQWLGKPFFLVVVFRHFHLCQSVALQRVQHFRRDQLVYLRCAGVCCWLRGGGWRWVSRGNCPGTWASEWSSSKPHCLYRSPSPQTDDTWKARHTGVTGKLRLRHHMFDVEWTSHQQQH